MGTEGADFVLGRTLGGRAAGFRWRADALGNLAIRRTATRGQSHAPKGRLVSREELEALLAWMAPREWVLLECLPSKIRAGAAREGLRRFACESLGWPATAAPFASHAATIPPTRAAAAKPSCVLSPPPVARPLPHRPRRNLRPEPRIQPAG